MQHAFELWIGRLKTPQRPAGLPSASFQISQRLRQATANRLSDLNPWLLTPRLDVQAQTGKV